MIEFGGLCTPSASLYLTMNITTISLYYYNYRLKKIPLNQPLPVITFRGKKEEKLKFFDFIQEILKFEFNEQGQVDDQASLPVI